MKNNKIFSTLLLATTLTAMVAGALSINSNVYRKVEADVEPNKTIYLYVPKQVKDKDGNNPITWDAEENNVKIYTRSDSSFHQMYKLQEHLFFYTLSSADTSFYFRTTISSTTYNSPSTSGTLLYYSNIKDSNDLLLEMKTYAYPYSDSMEKIGTWSNPATVFNKGATADAKAAAYAHAFITVLETGVCNGDSTNYTKLKSVWNGLGAVYSELNDDAKAKLLAADKEDNEDPLKDFATKYDYIYWKYGADPAFTKFINRSVTPRSSTYNPVVTDNSATKNIVVVASISGVSLSIVGLYFFLRKRKEDK